MRSFLKFKKKNIYRLYVVCRGDCFCGDRFIVERVDDFFKCEDDLLLELKMLGFF